VRIANIALAGLLVAASALFNVANAQAPRATQAVVKARGQLLCGVNEQLAGFSQLTDKGEMVGFEAEFCRAIAAAVLGDARKVKFVATTIQDRFNALRSGALDVLLRTSTTTLERTVKTGVLDAATIYLDGQAMAVRKASGITSLDQLAGKSICILESTPHGRNVREWFRFRSLPYTPVMFRSEEQLFAAFYAGKCDAVTGDISILSSVILASGKGANYLIIREILGMAPLGAFVRADDDQWFNVVRWTFNTLLDAEDSDITRANVDLKRRSGTDDEKRLLGVPPDDGILLGLDGDWAYNVIKQVGNYSEIFERTLGAATQWNFYRGVNALWNKGGVMYALPLR